jgi:ATP-dependent protease HslVU (ClpYQ) peptidase subunit
MTCIVGFCEKGKVYLGGDSAATAGWQTKILADGKVFKRNQIVFGVSGLPRLLNLLRYQLVIPPRKEEQSDDEYINVTFLNALRQCAREAGFTTVNNNLESMGSAALIGYRGVLYNLESNFNICRIADNYDVIGSGAEIACGVLYALRNSKTKPKARINLALEAAEYHGVGVRRPFHIVSV